MVNQSSVLINTVVSTTTDALFRDPNESFYPYSTRVRCCSARRLATITGVSVRSALKAIDFFEFGMENSPSGVSHGHGYSGPGSILGLQMEHHAFIYQLYVRNPSKPTAGYVQDLFDRFGVTVSNTTIHRWFMTIGPFKGTMRVTSRFPGSRNSSTTILQLQRYLDFVVAVDDSSKFVFADEKPMKEIDIYGTVRRDPYNGSTPPQIVKANSKNRYNILAAVTVKGGLVRPLEFVVLQQCTTSAIFLQFVRVLLEEGTLSRGDIFVVDNCTAYHMGDNVGIQETLFSLHGILMINLPPYHPEFNPVEFVFNTLVQRLNSKKLEYNSGNTEDFVTTIHNEL